MTNQLAKTEDTAPPPKKSALLAMSNRLNVEPDKLMETLKETAFKGASDAEFIALVVVANEHGLNPLTREIYAFPQKGRGIVPIVGIDGWLRIVNEHPQFDGLEVEVSEDGGHATCKIYRKDRGHATVVTEYLTECQRSTDPWKQFPRRMLRHKAIMQAARVAFGLGGIFDEDEARDVTPTAEVAVTPVFEEAKTMTTEEAEELFASNSTGEGGAE